MWEFAEWEVQTDKAVSGVCPHCYVRKDVGGGEDLVICPRVVVAWNESGFNSTGVCLDCILAAIDKIEREEA